jgi:L-ascorbate metabolism protein UlaG (beta-lactamase superfamily)
MEIKFLGHACFQITIGGKTIVFDPFITGNELARAAGVNIDDIKPDYILISHGHSDHIGDLVYLANKTNAQVISSFEICTWLGNQGYANSHPMNVGGKKMLEFGSVKMTYAMHSSSFSDGSYAGIASGFLLSGEGKTIYFAGDTALNNEMKLLGDLNKIDYALLPIGGNFTMDAIDANIAADFIKCKNIIAMHYDTFGFIKINHEESKQLFNQSGKELHIIKIGESIEI